MTAGIVSILKGRLLKKCELPHDLTVEVADMLGWNIREPASTNFLQAVKEAIAEEEEEEQQQQGMVKQEKEGGKLKKKVVFAKKKTGRNPYIKLLEQLDAMSDDEDDGSSASLMTGI